MPKNCVTALGMENDHPAYVRPCASCTPSSAFCGVMATGDVHTPLGSLNATVTDMPAANGAIR